jgi:hypothetical protein
MAKPEQYGDIMSNTPMQNNDARPSNPGRDNLLGEIGKKWEKFSKEDLATLKTNDELVSQVVAKYGIEKIAAQRDVDALMAGRHLTA